MQTEEKPGDHSIDMLICCFFLVFSVDRAYGSFLVCGDRCLGVGVLGCMPTGSGSRV